MRPLALALAFVALAGCKSHADRDYTSVNRSSVDFVFETFREGNRLRKKNLKQDVAFSERAPGNKMVRKTSREFAWQSFWAEEWSGFSDLARARKVERKSTSERLRNMRFGFLDSGD
jgi:hypothetical protein